MKTSALILGTTLLLAGLLQAAPEVGKPAQEFTLTDSTGKEHSLSDFKGKTVVLEWYNFGCPFVKKHYEIDNMQGLQKSATQDGVVWLTIVSSAPGKQGYLTPEDANAKKQEVESAATAILLDSDGKVGKLYGAKTTPEMVVIDKEGTVVYAGAIDDQPSPSADSVKEARNYVAAALEALKAGQPIETASTKPYGCSVKY